MLTKNDYAYVEVRGMILLGELAPGETLQQSRLAGEIGVSTTPLREAIRRLAAEGFVELNAHRDARVSQVTAEEAEHLYEIREVLDPMATRLAAERRSEEDVERILAAEQALVPFGATADADALRVHRDFHRSVYQASGNPVLIGELERLWDKADRYRVVGLRSREDSPAETARVRDEHRRIAQAVAAGDPGEAELAMRTHVQGSLGRRAIQGLAHGV
jgi:DNA-binding GntR family transcriptional regulator